MKKVDDEMKKPLLLDIGFDDEDEEDRKKNVMNMMMSPRVNARSLTLMV